MQNEGPSPGKPRELSHRNRQGASAAHRPTMRTLSQRGSEPLPSPRVNRQTRLRLLPLGEPPQRQVVPMTNGRMASRKFSKLLLCPRLRRKLSLLCMHKESQTVHSTRLGGRSCRSRGQSLNESLFLAGRRQLEEIPEGAQTGPCSTQT